MLAVGAESTSTGGLAAALALTEKGRAVGVLRLGDAVETGPSEDAAPGCAEAVTDGDVEDAAPEVEAPVQADRTPAPTRTAAPARASRRLC